METIKVTKCGECPFRHYEKGIGYYCIKADKSVGIGSILKDCPLKGKTIKIEVE